jgi:hypothetical protein
VDVSVYINPDLISFFNKKGLRLTECALFTRTENDVCSIHIDGGSLDQDKVKMNWSFNDNHLMNWYKPKSDLTKNVAKTKIDRAYIEFEPPEVELVHSQRVGFPSLVQVGMPHDITHIKGSRKCLSIILVNNFTHKAVSMPVAKILFADIINKQNAIL